MSDFVEQIKSARSKWQYTGKFRPDFAESPTENQESVWDYPRPPKIDPDERHILVKHDDLIIAETYSSIRILETASPPVFYISPSDANFDYLKEAQGSSICEWKGTAKYWSLYLKDRVIKNIGWSYPSPFKEFEIIKDYISFYPARLDCYVDGEKVMPQPGGFYGGWVTSEIIGPFKGKPGSGWW